MGSLLGSLWTAEYQVKTAELLQKDERELDMWALIAPNLGAGQAYVASNFIVQQLRNNEWYVVAPIWDPTDPFLLKIVVEYRQLKGLIYYEYISIIDTDRIVSERESKLVIEAHCSMRVRNHHKTSTHPLPDRDDRSV